MTHDIGDLRFCDNGRLQQNLTNSVTIGGVKKFDFFVTSFMVVAKAMNFENFCMGKDLPNPAWRDFDLIYIYLA